MMNPNINEEMVEPTVVTNTIKTPHPVHVNTPLSRYFAMALFIVLPFVGAYIGYRLAPERVVEVAVPMQNVMVDEDQHTKVNTSYTGPRVTYQKLSDIASTSDQYAIIDNQIVCKSDSKQASLPYSDEAVVSKDIDFRYLIIGTTLYWNCQMIGSIDKDTLRVVNNISSDIQDDTSVYFSGTKIADADGATFKPVTFTGPNPHKSTTAYMTDYYRDADRVYFIPTEYAVQVVNNAATTSFETLEAGPEDRYAKDMNAVYYRGHTIDVGSVKDFEVVKGLGIDGTALYVEGSKVVEGVLKTGVKMYEENGGGLGGSTNILVLDNVNNKWYLLELKNSSGELLRSLKPIAIPSKSSIGGQIYPAQR